MPSKLEFVLAAESTYMVGDDEITVLIYEATTVSTGLVRQTFTYVGGIFNSVVTNFNGG